VEGPRSGRGQEAQVAGLGSQGLGCHRGSSTEVLGLSSCFERRFEMFDAIEIEATKVSFPEFMALQCAIMEETAIDEGYESLDSWAQARPERFEEVSRDMRRIYKVYNLK